MDQEQTTEPVKLEEYFITFGLKYKREPHPILVDGIDPDGYVVIAAPDYETARRLAWSVFGQAWAFIYDQEEFAPEYHPLGELGRITCTLRTATLVVGGQ